MLLYFSILGKKKTPSPKANNGCQIDDHWVWSLQFLSPIYMYIYIAEDYFPTNTDNIEQIFS